MQSDAWITHQSQVSLARLLPRLEQRFAQNLNPAEWQGFVLRIQTHFPRLFRLLYSLYGHQYDFFFHLEDILSTATTYWIERSDELKALDAVREADPQWFQSHRMIGAMCYVDLFAGNLKAMDEKIPYLTELGITYLHLMPLFESPEGDNDGGYAVSSYRKVNPELGSVEDLREIATELRRRGISLALDFVFNHTSDEHDWAKKALGGAPEYQAYYRMYDTREMPDEFEKHITPVFPDEHPGCFTYRSKIKKWVWTTFHNYQWDLNYENAAVFNSMCAEMLSLANVGVEVLRLDAVAFLWKRLGTRCENLPEAHTLIQAFNAVVNIAAPAMVFKSEAIVPPKEVTKYISVNECPLSYNPSLMALLWNSIATHKVRLLRHAMKEHFAIPQDCAWVNYIRCHDDIGWVFDDADAAEIGINGSDHRRFLNDFFIGRFKDSFARGLPFQENRETGDCRVSGTAASLCGLESAIEANDEREIELAIQRILLIHGVILTIGGIPLFYLGDELGTLNDYSYTKDTVKDGDSRWVHRPTFDWERAESRRDHKSIEGRIYLGMLRLTQIRQQNLAFTRAETEIIETGNDHVFGYFRQHDGQTVMVLANFSSLPQSLAANRLRLLGMRKVVTDIVAGKMITATQQLDLAPYQFMVLVGSR